MKSPSISRRRYRAVSAIIPTVAILLLLAACAPAAAPQPAATATPAAPQPAATAVPAAAPKAPVATPTAVSAAPAPKAISPALAQVIEGAKKEGRVTVQLQSGVEAKLVREGIKKKYGVDLQIESQPSASYPAALAKALAEQKAGAVPSYDVLPLSDTTSVEAARANLAEKVDWEPLLAQGTPREMIQLDGYGVSVFNNHVGMVYNPKVVPPAESPKSFTDLGNPKWRGKIAAFNYANQYLLYAFVRGVDRTLAEFRAFMKNSPPMEVYANGATRYMSGEYPIIFSTSTYYLEAQKAGVPAEWASLDVSWVTTAMFHAIKGAKNPNAAKLFIVFLASPEGHKIYNDSGRGSMFYPGSVEFKINELDVKAGLPIYVPIKWPGAMDFYLSEKGQQAMDEISRIMKGE
ncbi:MAG: extracellular solute-binding protein [Chloroflexi bacterium]|nr:extracellular solute-binding protein [Chloroflexota bacterium]